MAWDDCLQSIMAAVTDPAVFGEAVTLPDGTIEWAVFDPYGSESGWLPSDTGLLGRPGEAPAPTLTARADTAIQLDDVLTVRGIDYRAVRVTPDACGVTVLLTRQEAP